MSPRNFDTFSTFQVTVGNLRFHFMLPPVIKVKIFSSLSSLSLLCLLKVLIGKAERINRLLDPVAKFIASPICFRGVRELCFRNVLKKILRLQPQ